MKETKNLNYTYIVYRIMSLYIFRMYTDPLYSLKTIKLFLSANIVHCQLKIEEKNYSTLIFDEGIERNAGFGERHMLLFQKQTTSLIYFSCYLFISTVRYSVPTGK